MILAELDLLDNTKCAPNRESNQLKRRMQKTATVDVDAFSNSLTKPSPCGL